MPETGDDEGRAPLASAAGGRVIRGNWRTVSGLTLLLCGIKFREERFSIKSFTRSRFQRASSIARNRSINPAKGAFTGTMTTFVQHSLPRGSSALGLMKIAK
jgi:hypothetical protein